MSNLGNLRARDLMSRNLETIEALRADELVGLLSFTDILDSVASSRYQERTQAEE